MMRRAFRCGVLQAVVLAVLLALCLSRIPGVYTMALIGVEIQPAQEPGQATVSFSGLDLQRANTLYIDGKPVGDCRTERINYGEYRVTLPCSGLNEGEWYRLELGHACWGLIRLMSNPVWIEWPAQ